MSQLPAESGVTPALEPASSENRSDLSTAASPSDQTKIVADVDRMEATLQNALQELDSQLDVDELQNALRGLLADC